MIVLKTKRELECMRETGRITAGALQAGCRAVEPGRTTMEIDRVIHDYIVSHGAIPSSLGYGGFPGSACISVNDQVIHGIPSKDRKICEGDIVSIDVTALYKGFNGDTAYTVAVGEVGEDVAQLMRVTAECLQKGVAAAQAGSRISDISRAVQTHAESFGYGVIRDFVGHGVGAKMHEEPEVPNFVDPRHGRGPRLMPGMTIAVEPMIAMGTWQVKQLSDGWTIVTKDGKPAAHYEHTIAITDNGPVILTLPD